MKTLKNFSARNARKIAEENSELVAFSLPCNGYTARGKSHTCNKRLIIQMKSLRSVQAMREVCKNESWSMFSASIKTADRKFSALTASCQECSQELVKEIIINSQSFESIPSYLSITREAYEEIIKSSAKDQIPLPLEDGKDEDKKES